MSVSTHLRRRLGVAALATILAVGAPLLTFTDSVDAIEFTAGGVVSSARVDRASATVGDTVAVTVAVKSNATRSALIDIEIYDRSGRKVFQKYWDNQSLTTGQTREFRTSWGTAGRAAGTYTVKVGVFRPGWTSLIHWNDRAGAVTLATVAPTTTSPTTTSPTTTSPTTTSPTTTAPAPTTTTTPATTTTVPAPTTTSTSPSTTTVPPVVGSVCDVGCGCGVAVWCAVCGSGA